MYITLAEFNKNNKEKKRNIKAGIAQTLGAGYLGQKAIRSGLPRSLGVRLESHSTSRKNAKEILKNGGWLDPNKSGTGAIGTLDVAESIGLSEVTDPNKARNKVYITGIHKNVGKRTLNTPLGVVEIDPSKESPLQHVLNRIDQRRGYRGQSSINWEKVNKDNKRIAEVIKERRNLKLDTPEEDLKWDALLKEENKLKEATKKRLTNAKMGAMLKSLLPWHGRSLYIGGSDEYFNKNFKPDFDDVRAMYSEDKVKVHGNRIAATLEALKREGDGNTLKGISKLVKANKARTATGLLLTGAGLAGSSYLGNKAYKNLTGDTKVKEYTRKDKNGKLVRVKSFNRKVTKKKK